MPAGIWEKSWKALLPFFPRSSRFLKAADLLLKGGGFGVVAVDITDLPASNLEKVPPQTWFRFQRTIENTPTILLITGQKPVAQSSAALVLRVEMQQPVWRGTPLP